MTSEADLPNKYAPPPSFPDQGQVLHVEEDILSLGHYDLQISQGTPLEIAERITAMGSLRRTGEQTGKGFSGLASEVYEEMQAPQVDEVTVQPGDTLFSIAKTYGVSVDELKKANSLTSNLIRVDQRLIIPPKTSQPPDAPMSCTGHTVQAGETAYGIATKSGTDVQTLQKLNPALTDPDKIHPDQCLNLSSAGDADVSTVQDPYAVNPPTPVPTSSSQVSAPASPPPQAVFSRTAPESSSKDPFREAKAAVDFATGNPGEYSAEMILSGIFSIFILAILSKYGADSLANRIRRR